MKLNILKLNILILFCLVFLINTGCSDLLDQNPQGDWVLGDNKDGSYQADIFTLYAKLRGSSITSGTPPLCIHNVRSEDVDKGSTPSDGADHGAMYDDFDYNPSNGLIEQYWTANYEVINIVNRILANMEEDVEEGYEMTEGDYTNVGEAKFFRAFCYFNLVRAFGEIPLIDFRVDDAAEVNVPKTTAAKIYELIDSDLQDATLYLPQKWESRYIGRLTWGAARSLHARTYMMRSDWGNMYTAAKDVIDSGIYNLSTPYSTIFREEGENTSESIFEIQCTATTSLPDSEDIGSIYARVQGVRGAGEWDLGWGWHTPSDILAEAFEANDPRRDETLLYFLKGGDADPSSIPANEPYGERPVASSEVTNNYYNKKVYTNPSWRQLYTKQGFWVNIRMIRYSDVVLMAAEAANEQGNSAEALGYLEQVRARARGGNNDILPAITTTNQSELRDAIRHERRVELAMEWDRFYDLVRWGIAEQVLHAAGKTNYQPRHALLPIPQSEVDKSNGVLVQNPNY